MAWHSAIYEGYVQHRRYTPVEHAFRYSIALVLFDLDELPEVLERRGLWSATRPAPARFRRRDYLGDARQPLKEAVADVVEAALGRRPTGPIRLLTQPRYWGFVFNPISVYYCFDPKGTTLDAVVCEVSNTPWGERCTYVLDAMGEHELHAETAKAMHVSPFMTMDLRYRFALTTPGDELRFHIDCAKEDAVHLDATLTLTRRPLTTASLHRTLWRYPFMTGKVLLAIYWQALRLWWKRVPFVPHPTQTRQTEGTPV